MENRFAFVKKLPFPGYTFYFLFQKNLLNNTDNDAKMNLYIEETEGFLHDIINTIGS